MGCAIIILASVLATYFFGGEFWGYLLGLGLLWIIFGDNR